MCSGPPPLSNFAAADEENFIRHLVAFMAATYHYMQSLMKSKRAQDSQCPYYSNKEDKKRRVATLQNKITEKENELSNLLTDEEKQHLIQKVKMRICAKEKEMAFLNSEMSNIEKSAMPSGYGWIPPQQPPQMPPLPRPQQRQQQTRPGTPSAAPPQKYPMGWCVPQPKTRSPLATSTSMKPPRYPGYQARQFAPPPYPPTDYGWTKPNDRASVPPAAPAYTSTGTDACGCSAYKTVITCSN